jgi:hypothetical protein
MTAALNPSIPGLVFLAADLPPRHRYPDNLPDSAAIFVLCASAFGARCHQIVTEVTPTNNSIVILEA